jgi:WhiB family transcriptional regulator, redox-sensing transcriptional regulator
MARSVQIGNATVSVANNDTIEFRNALCKYTDPEIFFPTTTSNQQAEHLNESNRTAIKICKSCEHEVECAAFALARPELYGIWGGLTNTNRKRMRRKYGIRGLSHSVNSNDNVNSN